MLVGFPSDNFTAIIAANYMVDALKVGIAASTRLPSSFPLSYQISVSPPLVQLPMIADITCPDFPARCVVDNKVPGSAMRLYGSRELVVAVCEFKILGSDIAHRVVEAILDFCQRHKMPDVVGERNQRSE